MTWVFSYIVYFIISTAVLLWSYMNVPGFTRYFGEDGCIENISAGLFLASFVVILFSFRGRMKGKGFRMSLIAAFFSILCFLEEMSYGKRLFGFKSTLKYGKSKEVDQAQDLYDFSFYWIKKNWMIDGEVAAYAMLGIALLIVLGALLLIRKKMTGEVFLLKDTPFLLFSFFVLLVVFAKTFDLDFLDSQTYRHIPALEEIFELNAAGALLLCCLNIYLSLKHRNASSTVSLPAKELPQEL